jgi:endonuclease YncB( thermonuclease family)
MPVDQPDRMRARPARRIVCCAAKWREVLICVLLACSGAVHGDDLFGKVVKIADGDTLTILVGKEAHRVRRMLMARLAAN